MNTLLNVVIAVVAIEHFGFLVLEMFFWDHPVGRKIFHMTEAVSKSSARLAANQGLYNGFLSAGLVWGIISGLFSVQLFFLSCIVVAGTYWIGVTLFYCLNKSIFKYLRVS